MNGGIGHRAVRDGIAKKENRECADEYRDEQGKCAA